MGREATEHSDLLNSWLSAKSPVGGTGQGSVNNYTPSVGLDFAKKNKALFLEQKDVLNVCCHLVAGMWIGYQMTDSRKVFLSVT